METITVERPSVRARVGGHREVTYECAIQPPVQTHGGPEGGMMTTSGV
jgi:hypothetical protein